MTDAEHSPPTSERVFEGVEINRGSVETTDENLYRIKGLNPTSAGCGFSIHLTMSYGDALAEVSTPDAQDRLKDVLSELLGDMYSHIEFRGDSFLVSNITIAGNATGLDLHNRGTRYEYATHNVDTREQALDLIAIFAKWINYSRAIIRLAAEDRDQTMVNNEGDDA